MIGKVLFNYEVSALLGSGGMGSVYLAEHQTLGRKAAIKVLLPELARNQQIRDRFINEARTLSLLSHQNIVTLYDFSDVDGNLVLVMEYTEGTPLDTVIEKITGAIPEQRCTNIFRQVLDGFSYAHRKGVVHRDIKPANIILQSDDTPKILDFGIAKIVEGDVKLTKTGTRMGSVVYMSPEQVMGRDVDQRSDIYSLGVTLFEMLSGRLPYDTQTESEFDIQTKIVREPLPPIRSINPNVSETLESAIIKATEKDVNYRFQSCEEFSNALGQSEFSYTPQKTVYQQPQQNRTVFNEPAHLNARLSYPQKRSKTPIILFGGGAAAVIVILLIFFLTQNDDTSVEKVTANTKENLENKISQNKDSKNNTSESSLIKVNLTDWIQALNNRNPDLSKFYSDNVIYYSWGSTSRSKLLADKRQFFDSWSSFNLEIEEPLINVLNENKYECVYDKTITSSNISNGKVYDAKVQSRLVFEKFGERWLITEESDPVLYYKNKNW
jgi:serine/threonine protein kinase